MVVCTSKVVEMKEDIPFSKEYSALCIEDGVIVDRVV